MNPSLKQWIEATLGEIPSYACPCCGYTNNDMFYDGRDEPTESEIAEFEMYKATMHYFQKKEKS